MRFAKAFLRFLWDFFVGDTPELFVGACVAVGVAWLVHRAAPSVAVVALPASVAAVLGWSLHRSRGR